MTFHINSMVPELWCSDFDESLRFYTESLGFGIGQHKKGSTHAYLTLGPSQLMISSFEQDGTWETGPFENPFGRGINFCFFVEDSKGLHDAVTARGVKPFVELYTIWYWRPDSMGHYREFAVLDPDGYLLRFSQCIGSRPIEPDDADHVFD